MKSKEIQEYFDGIKQDILNCYKIVNNDMDINLHKL